MVFAVIGFPTGFISNGTFSELPPTYKQMYIRVGHNHLVTYCLVKELLGLPVLWEYHHGSPAGDQHLPLHLQPAEG